MKIITKLLVFFLPLALVPLLLAGYFGIVGIWSINQQMQRMSESIASLDTAAENSTNGIEKAVIAQIQSDYGHIARHLSGHLQIHYANLLRILETLAAANSLGVFLQNQEKHWEVLTQQVYPMFQQVLEAYHLTEISVLDTHGHEMLRRAGDIVPVGGDPLFDAEPLPNQRVDESNSPWFVRRLADSESLVTKTVYFSEDFDPPRPVLSLSIPLKYKLGSFAPIYGEIKAYLQMGITVEALIASLLMADPGFKGNFILTDGAGKIVAHPDKNIIGQSMETGTHLTPDYHVIKEPVLGGTLDLYVLASKDQMQKTTAIVGDLSISIKHWVGQVGELSNAVNQRLGGLKGRLVMITTLVAVLFSVIVFLVARRISEPLSHLSQAAVEIAKGNLQRRPGVPDNVGREIALLSQNLDEMRQNLKAQIENRDRLVAARTRELQAAKNEAEMASQAKGKFLASMSHELRTPLHAILGYTKLIAKERNMTEEQLIHLATIDRSGENLLELINDILALSKLEAGREVLQAEPFDLHGLVLDLDAMFRLPTEEKNLVLSIERDPHLPRFVRGDQKKLRRILINLLGNAIKFTDSGTVTLHLRSQEPSSTAGSADCLHVRVADSGTGIAATELETIFEPFVQAADGRKPNHGTGLGLSISREFVRLMGGELTAHSRPGEGTVFEFTVGIETVESSQIDGDQPGSAPGRLTQPTDLGYHYTPTAGPLGRSASGSDQGRTAFDLKRRLQEAHVPMELLGKLEEALERSDMSRIDVVIGKITVHDEAIGNALEQLSSEFQYDEMLAIIQGVETYKGKKGRHA